MMWEVTAYDAFSVMEFAGWRKRVQWNYL